MATISTCCFIVKPTHYKSLNPSLQLQTFRPHAHLFFRNNLRLRSFKSSIKAVRASIDFTTAPGAIVESDKLPSDVRKRAMDAIDSCGRRVTVGDVASKAGLDVYEAQKALQALAADSNGFLEVSDEGDVLYVFRKDYRSNLAAKSLRIKIEPFLEKAKLAAEYVVRVSFGTALIASIVLVYTTIIAILSSRSDEDNRGRRSSRSYDTGFMFYLSPTDLFWYWDPYYYKRRQLREENQSMNFVDSVFSFVFGDGDPNQGIEEERWKLIGEYIASNGGVVAAEELAPYLDVGSANNTDDDSYILPVLIKFNGEPDVDDEGNILYRFPSFQRTATSQENTRKEYVGRRWADSDGGLEKFFKEKQWSFSKTSSFERAMVISLGGFNLLGIIILEILQKDTTRSLREGFISFIYDRYPLLQIYAFSFFAIPLVRWLFVQITNARIGKRNRAREQRAKALELPNLSLRRKLLSARDMAQKTIISKDRIVYSTDKDMDQQNYEAQEWDQRLREMEMSTN